jgi:hypothetical protein
MEWKKEDQLNLNASASEEEKFHAVREAIEKLPDTEQAELYGVAVNRCFAQILQTYDLQLDDEGEAGELKEALMAGRPDSRLPAAVTYRFKPFVKFMMNDIYLEQYQGLARQPDSAYSWKAKTRKLSAEAKQRAENKREELEARKQRLIKNKAEMLKIENELEEKKVDRGYEAKTRKPLLPAAFLETIKAELPIEIINAFREERSEVEINEILSKLPPGGLRAGLMQISFPVLKAAALLSPINNDLDVVKDSSQTKVVDPIIEAASEKLEKEKETMPVVEPELLKESITQTLTAI